MLVTMGSVQLDEFYPAVVIAALMRIVRDPSLSGHHTMVIQVIPGLSDLLVSSKILSNFMFCIIYLGCYFHLQESWDEMCVISVSGETYFKFYPSSLHSTLSLSNHVCFLPYVHLYFPFPIHFTQTFPISLSLRLNSQGMY
jgi:hypothetical protein